MNMKIRRLLALLLIVSLMCGVIGLAEDGLVGDPIEEAEPFELSGEMDSPSNEMGALPDDVATLPDDVATLSNDVSALSDNMATLPDETDSFTEASTDIQDQALQAMDGMTEDGGYERDYYDFVFEKKSYKISLTINLGDMIRIWKKDGNGNPVSIKSKKSGSKRMIYFYDEGDYLAVMPNFDNSTSVTVKASNGYTITIKLKVVDPFAPESVAFEEKTITVEVGESPTLKPVLSPAHAKTSYYWKSDKPKIVGVTASGELILYKEGKAKITVTTSNKKKATITVIVADPYKPESVSLPSTIQLSIGESYELIPEHYPDTAVSTFTWSTSSKKYVSVSKGVVKGLKVGSSKITVKTANGKKATCKVVVVRGSADLYFFMGKKISEASKEAGYKTKISENGMTGYSDATGYAGILSMSGKSSSKAKVEAVLITGPCADNICGVRYGMDYVEAFETLCDETDWELIESNDGADLFYNGEDFVVMYYENNVITEISALSASAIERLF